MADARMPGLGWEGSALEFMHRLRQLDWEVEQLRTALAALQQHLATQRQPALTPGHQDPLEYLRAYV